MEDVHVTLNSLLIMATILCIALLVTFLYLKSKRERPDIEQSDKLTFDRLLDIVKYSLADLIKDENFAGLADEEFESMYKRKARIVEAMRNCVYGIDSAKLIVQDLIRSIVADILKTEDDILQLFDFRANYLEPRVKFEILMYFYKKKYGKDALSEMINEYRLDRERYAIEDKTQPSYLILNEDIDAIYAEKSFDLTYHVMLDILSVMIYQKYKGFGVIDTLREMNINGFNCGTSGSILSALLNKDKKIMKAPRSVWLYFNGKYIHLRFLTFHSEEELRRVVQLLCRYNNPGPLTEKRGFLVNTMYDKSRVLALRPPASEYWAVFIRKFTLSDSSLPALIDKPYVNDAFLAINLVMYLMMGQVLADLPDGRVQEDSNDDSCCEIYRSEIYDSCIGDGPGDVFAGIVSREKHFIRTRNGLCIRVELQDALKKSDAAVSIVGEVATDPIAARMIQMGQVASIFTIFSHHANVAEQLVYAIRNSLVNAGGFSGNMITAEQQVIDVIRVDIHLNYTTDGSRYIERISEIVRLDVSVPYPDYDRNDPLHSMNEITKEYYNRQTDRKSFTTRDILKYNLETNTYETYDWFTTELTQKMLDVMPLDKVQGFQEIYLG